MFPCSLRRRLQKERLAKVSLWKDSLREAMRSQSLLCIGKAPRIHKRTKMEVAVKIVRKKDLSIKDIELLKREIEVLKILKNSENIIDVYDIYNTKNNTYIITELCDGGDLANFISKKQIIPEAEAIELMTQILRGYENINNHGIIHRDLKPANIFLKNN